MVSARKLEPIFFLFLHLVAQTANHRLQRVIGTQNAAFNWHGKQFIESIEFADFFQALGIRV